jgi:hypothetical protein
MMRKLMKSMVVESGQLLEVECLYHTDLPNDIGLIKLAFQQGTYFVVAKEDDSLELTRDATSIDFEGIKVSSEFPWHSAIGKHVRWVWTMVNQQGYLDGLQFEFANNITQEPIVIQLIAMASGIDIHKRISLGQERIINMVNIDNDDMLMSVAA